MSEGEQATEAQAPEGKGSKAGKKRMSVADALERAGQLFGAGRLQAAEKLARDIISSRPQNPDAYNILGVSLHRLGQAEEGIAALKQAITLNATNPNYFANLGEMERKAGRLDEAEAALNRAIALDPKSEQAHNNLGIVHYEKRQYDLAAASYRTALALHDEYPEAHNNLGNALRALDDIHEAMKEYERAIELRENYAEAYNNMGSALRDLGQQDEAELSYRRAVQSRPNYREALKNLGELLIFQDKYDDALRVLGEALEAHPKDAGLLVAVARAQIERGATGQAERAINMALEQEPENVDALCVQGQLCQDTDNFDKAIAAYEKALSINPNSVEALNMYGVSLKSVGRMDDARTAFMKALELRPRAIGAYSNIVDLENFTKEHPLYKTMTDLIKRARDPNHERFMGLHFALGKAHDDAGEYETAIKHFNIGANIKRGQLKYDEAESFSFFDEIRATFNEAYFAKLPYEGDPTTLPVFIIGMPRSGSTMTEQILASHPSIHGAGEIKLLSSSLGSVRVRFPNLGKFPTMARRMNERQFAQVAAHYLHGIAEMSSSATRVTDKLLTNYYFAGFIATIFPKAKIIHTMRNPMDTCLSSYTKLYKDDMPHSYDLTELGRYYCKYQQLMEHWRKVLPAGMMYETQYEDMVANHEIRAREIIDFLGLPWNDKCIDFHKTERPVKTASVSQVRKPLYSSSVDRWRRYGDTLLPLKEALDAGPQPARTR